MLNNFRSYQLAKELYRQCQAVNHKGEIKDQLERASLSIVLNLAEGSAKFSSKDRKRFYSIALGSLRETQAILDLIDESSAIDLASQLGAHIWCLIRAQQ